MLGFGRQELRESTVRVHYTVNTLNRGILVPQKKL